MNEDLIWHARRAAWRDDWEYVETFLQRHRFDSCFRPLVESGESGEGFRAMIWLGVLTSNELHKGNLDEAVGAWRQCVPLVAAHQPALVGEFKSYFEESIVVFARLTSQDVPGFEDLL